MEIPKYVIFFFIIFGVKNEKLFFSGYIKKISKWFLGFLA